MMVVREQQPGGALAVLDQCSWVTASLGVEKN